MTDPILQKYLASASPEYGSAVRSNLRRLASASRNAWTEHVAEAYRAGVAPSAILAEAEQYGHKVHARNNLRALGAVIPQEASAQ